MAPPPFELTVAAPHRLQGMRPRPEATAFLARAGHGASRMFPLAGDASFRRYFRVSAGDQTWVLMDAPPEHEDVRPFVKIAGWLREQGLSAPQIHAVDEKQGFLLIEDFGDRVMAPEIAAGRVDETLVYEIATDILVELGRSPVPGWLQSYDREVLLREVMLFPEWYLKAAGVDADIPSYIAAWDRVWEATIAESAGRPVAVLRDYHADNLLLLDRPGTKSLGLLDFQDALAGHPAYDLVSLLQDARRHVSEELERRMLDLYAARADLAAPDIFRAAYEVLGAQRNVKILGIFVRLRDRDNRIGYVERLPRVWSYIERNFRHPALAPVRDWFETHVPHNKRSAWCR